jgi:hypothetical protein
VQARIEQNQSERIRLYHEIEEQFFGYEGEMPIAPLYLSTSYIAVHNWLNYTPSLWGGITGMIGYLIKTHSKKQGVNQPPTHPESTDPY